MLPNRKAIAALLEKYVDSPVAVVRSHPSLERGVFASAPIPAGAHIASFDGQIYQGYYTHELPEKVRDHGMQIAHDLVADANGVAKIINHSCNPNAGVKDLVRIVAMRDIEAGEEICWDYDMSDNAEWVMHCTCGSVNCRKILMGYRYLPQSFRDRYGDFISDYLLEQSIPVQQLPVTATQWSDRGTESSYSLEASFPKEV